MANPGPVTLSDVEQQIQQQLLKQPAELAALQDLNLGSSNPLLSADAATQQLHALLSVTGALGGIGADAGAARDAGDSVPKRLPFLEEIEAQTLAGGSKGDTVSGAAAA